MTWHIQGKQLQVISGHLLLLWLITSHRGFQQGQAVLGDFSQRGGCGRIRILEKHDKEKHERE